MRLALTATLTIASVAVAVHSWTSPAPVQHVGAGPIDTLVTTADPSLPATSGGRVAVVRDVAPVSAARTGDIPVTAMLAYQRAATVVGKVDRTCGLSWTLLAAIGGVESDHGRDGGAVLGSDGVSKPLIRGVALDGHGKVAKVADTDAGRLDGDRRWDHAVGPMQFLPSTWTSVGVDADGDGKRSADDLDDAALGAAVFLCSAPGSLDTRSGVRTALHRYNPSAAYVARVMALEHEYRTGDYALPALPQDGPVLVRAEAPLPTVEQQEHPGRQPGHEQQHQQPTGHPEGAQTGMGGDHQQPGGSPGHLPDPTPTPDPAPTPDPTPTPTPTPDPTPEPGAPTELTGILQACGTEEEPAWCVADAEQETVLDVGDEDYLAADALADFDADGTVETNADELAGLADTEVTVTVALTDDAPAVLLAIGDDEYVADEDTEAPR
ncbi:lytic transglycosylase domain-containing protein [Nocardioides aquiterrae]|uniref:lytic transglycosylase domain-containing protein n=1 Tax=Nocardioides aquiterrae TaxID=203799 RepID=UPI0031D92248